MISINPVRKNKPILTVLSWFFGVFFLLGAIVTIQHPILALLYGLLGFILLPPGHLWMEKTFRFLLTTKAKSVLVVALFVAAVSFAAHYAPVDQPTASLSASRTGQEEKAGQELQRKDSLLAKENIDNSRIRAFDLVKSGKYQDALSELNKLIEKDANNSDLLYNRALCYSHTGKIREAVADCDGSTSSATGRGACSHHGGVCAWNAPVYEESRKYE
jgi:tetratricopeptide (TPR) repeat protein